ncbi:polysaccharide biosynthesis/export family protein [Novosphingobium sp.]|uniref:polysaccharide biosynthesis/export family protein n=1 Tax=Novosphingobium sp. TaxID=1874826 RepID=UPI001D70A169|nr:polysaccharide biosynthesis/export family protein [Novosphingobium sp.]MBX9663148.1 polysaccharide export protein [Novosphingobium sp.]
MDSKHDGGQRARHHLALAVTGAVALLLGGCVGASAPPISTADVAAGLESYHLGAGDRVRVTVFNEPTLTGEYNITPGGALAFPLIGVVAAGGRTIDAVQQELTAKLAEGYVNDPRVSVEVLNYRPFYILGEVNRPGEYSYASGMTVEQAIARAGGFTYRANEKTVFLRRQTGKAESAVSLRSAQVAVLPGDTIRIGERYF